MSLPVAPLAVAAIALALAQVGCGDDGGGGSGAAGQGGGGGAGSSNSSSASGTVEVLQPGGTPLAGQSACEVTITTDIPIPSADHVDACSPVSYPTNPPSGGDHWGVWAAFLRYDDQVVPRGMLVHSLEHGAIAMLHDCPGCESDVLDAFDDAMNEHGADQKCLASGQVARFIVAPDPELDHPVAMAAWGATYVATCIDPPSIAAFVEAHYARGPEDTCAAGKLPAEIGCD
jgi:hypothetical protein